MAYHDSGHDMAAGMGGAHRPVSRRTVAGIGCLCVAIAILAVFAKAVSDARRAALWSNCQCPLNQLRLALECYHETYGQFPPAYLTDERGNRMHRWRVLILPYVDQQTLYDAYDFNEAWNGPNNSRLANRMPRTFWSPSEGESDMFTNIVTITGPETAFPGDTSTRLQDLKDGTANTILLTEIANSDISWLEPRDLEVGDFAYTVNDALRPSISAARWRTPFVVFADSISAYGVSEDISPDTLKALTTIAGSEPVTRTKLLADGHLGKRSPEQILDRILKVLSQGF